MSWSTQRRMEYSALTGLGMGSLTSDSGSQHPHARLDARQPIAECDRVAVSNARTEPPYLYRPVIASGSIGGPGGVVALVLGVPAPCPPIAAGSASGRTGQGPGGSPVGVAGAVGVLDAAAWELIMPAVGAGSRRVRRVEVSGSGVLPSCAGDLAVDRPGQEEGQPALPGCSGLGRCPGDKMIDWLSPPWGCGRSV